MSLFDLAIEFGLEPKRVSSTNGGEYHSPCPTCGGKDRFFIQPYREMSNCSGYYSCRRCGIYGDSIQFCRDFLGLSFSEALQRLNVVIDRSNVQMYRKKDNVFDPTHIVSPSQKWIERMLSFVTMAHDKLKDREDILADLSKRGISESVIKKFKIGWNPQDYFPSRVYCGLDDELDENGKSKSVWLPKGIVVPTSEPNGDIIRVKIRRDDWQKGDSLPKYVAVSGSMNGLNIIGDTKHAMMIVVESELDAYAVYNKMEDFAFLVSVGSNIKNPDDFTHFLAQEKPNLLVCRDNDDAGKAMFNKWEKLYSHAQDCPVPIGKDVGEAIENGFNVRKFFLKKLPVESILNGKNNWSIEDLELVTWFLKYVKERTVTKHIYENEEKEIALGSEGLRAKSGELQRNLLDCKEHVEWLRR